MTGRRSRSPADQVVVGDVVLLTAGDDVCADGRIIQAASLQIDESGLTGESVPASKSAEVIGGDSKPGVGDQSNMAFMNSPVTHGSGVMIVTGTGADTEVGNISGMLKSTPTLKTPLSAQLDTLTLWIAGAAGLTIAIMFALGASRGDSTKAIFTTAIALALAAVPMAMPTVLQVILSNGSMTLAAEGAVVKSLASVETLGSTSAINSDKTGTLTLNQVTVVEVIDPTDRYAISGTGYGLEGDVEHAAGNTNTIEQAILPFLVCNDAKLVDGKVVGDPTEGALLVLGHKAKLDIEGTQAEYPRLATLPFDPTYKLMAVFADAKDASGNAVVRAFVKGAGPAVLGRASSALANGETVPWGDEQQARAVEEMERLGGKGLRIMVAATRDIAPSDFDPQGDLLSLVTGLQLTAMVGMIDPPRAESKDAVRNAQNANIRVRMVTGDDVITGEAIARQLGIEGEAILGADFAALSEEERLSRIDGIGVVGRVAPEHKVLMVETLRKKGDVVAMTGDGVNDAPAIKSADIGIAMGTGTEVAKNAAKMILTDDNFATIVKAVSEGRKLYDNMLKYIRFMMVALVTYVVTFLLASLLNIAERAALLRHPDPLDQLRDHGPRRHRARPRQGDARADEAQASPAHGLDHVPSRAHHGRAGRPLHVRRDRPADRLRQGSLRQRRDRQHDRPGRVLPHARRRGPRMPRPDGDGPARGDAQQQHRQPRDRGGGRPRAADRPRRRPHFAARHAAAHRDGSG